jgi:hypothetical protein
MRHDEYERRKRALETQFREDVELLQAGYQAKLRALEMVWMMSSEANLPAGRSALGASETLRLSETLHPSESLGASETVSPPPAPPSAPPPARPRGQVALDFEDILPQLPEEFDKTDVDHALGYKPTRPTLYRVLHDFISTNRIAMARNHQGPSPTRYRKLPPPDAG